MIKIIPQPTSVVERKGKFLLSQKEGVNSQIDFNITAIFPKFKKSKTGRINVISDEKLSDGEYKLNVNKDKIEIFAKEETGAFYALVSLKWLTEFKEKEVYKIPCCTVYDKPKYGWRGQLVDVCRHMFSVNKLKQTIRMMSLLKMNILHLVLTNDQGIRVEINSHPEFNKIGSYRYGEIVYENGKQSFAKGKYGGYYTKKQLKDIIAYAKQRYIDIIPEVDVPGHSVAFIASNKDLSCEGKKVPVWEEWGVSDLILCAGKEKVYKIIGDVIKEVAEIFPFPYFHLGGDEVLMNRWQACKHCQNKIKELGLKDCVELKHYMVDRFKKIVVSMGKKPIIWNDDADKVDKDYTIQFWTKADNLEDTKVNNSCIVSDFMSTYFDFGHSYVPLERVYGFDPIESCGTSSIGGEGALWTERIRNDRKYEFNLYPRICAIAEGVWGSKKDYKCFLKRLKPFYRQCDLEDIGYSKFYGKEKYKVLSRTKINEELHTFYCNPHLNDEFEKYGKK